MHRWRDGYIKMFKPELRNEVISLGAIYQASGEIKKIAWEGKINNKDPLLLDIKNFKELKFKDFYYNHIKYMRIMEYEKLIEYIKD